MYFTQLPNCCGIHEVGNFSGDASQEKACLKSQLQLYAEQRASNHASDYEVEFTPGLLVATTTALQKPAIQALKFHRFRKLMTFTNPGTSNRVTLWVKKLGR